MSKFILSAFADEISHDLNIQMDVLDKHNIKYIEVRNIDGRSITEYSISEVKKIKKELDSRGFRVSSLGSPIGKQNIIEDFEPTINLFKHCVEIAKVLETAYMRTFSFFIPKGEEPEMYRDEVVGRFHRFAEIAKRSGITLAHENEKQIYGDTPERCVDLINEMGGSIKAVFDPANFVQCGINPYPEAFTVLKQKIAYLHIKDALYEGGKVVPAGEGDGCISEILQSLYKEGFEGFISIEPHLAQFRGFQALERGSEDLPRYNNIEKFGIAVSALNRILDSIYGGRA